MSTEIYGKEYQHEYQKRELSELGKKIYNARWEFVERHCNGHLRLLDYGCANGGFHKSSSNGFDAHGYDINPFSPFNKVEGSLDFDILTFWDSLEHIPDFPALIRLYSPKWIFLSTPNLESVMVPAAHWKHYKPHEHIYYFDRHSIKTIFEALGYDIKEINFEEGLLRNPKDPQAIISVALKKRS